MALSRLLGGLWTVTKVEGWAGAPLLPGFILLGVCDWRFWPVGGGGARAYGLYPKSRARWACLVFTGSSCYEASVTLYLWFQF